MIKVLFIGREHRVRRRETIQNPPQNIKFLTIQPIEEMKKDHELSNTKLKWVSKIKRLFYFIRENHLIKENKLKKIDAIYSPGHIVFNNKPWILEVDNVSVISYYNLFLLKIMKPVLKYYLKKNNCKKIICISDAAKKSIEHTFNDKTINKKCIIIYPYIESKKRVKTTQNNSKIEFLFVSTNFYLKGGKEVVNSFLKLSKDIDNISLTIITKTKEIEEDHLKKIMNSDKIKIIEANLPKKILIEKYFLKSDVFILPTYQDSFGMVYLEALSTGLAIISTDMFAVKEMVTEKNGILINTPIKYFNKDYTPNIKYWHKNITKIAKNGSFKKLEKELYTSMKSLLDKNKLRKMKKESESLFKKKFDSKKRNDLLKKVIEEAICVE